LAGSEEHSAGNAEGSEDDIPGSREEVSDECTDEVTSDPMLP